MDAATINDRIYAGRAKAAARIGYPFDLYRPATALDPLTVKVATTPAAFNAGDNSYAKPNLYGKPVWFADFDARLARPGDYLVNAARGEAYFVAAMQSLLPVAVVACDRRVRISRPQPFAAPAGAVGYSGVSDASSASADVLGGNPSTNGGVFRGWPAAIYFGPSRDNLKDALPGGTARQVGWYILLPLSVPITIHAGDRIVDDLSRDYVVAGAELSDLGWRLQATEAHA